MMIAKHHAYAIFIYALIILDNTSSSKLKSPEYKNCDCVVYFFFSFLFSVKNRSEQRFYKNLIEAKEK